jgi:regulator of sigma E protease
MFHLFGYEITILQIVLTVFGIGLVIFIHELGHFMTAKKFGLKVEQFAFGFGPEVFGFTKGETRYSINALPLGGMVKMPGEDIDSASGDPREFFSQPWYKRLTIAFFGPLMNYILAVILFFFVIYCWGLARPSAMPIVGQAIDGRPAQKAGLLPDDKITKVNSQEVKTWEEMAAYIYNHPEERMILTVDRGGKLTRITLTSAKDPATGVGLIGIAPKMETEKLGLAGSAKLSVKLVVFQSVYTLKYLGTKLIKWEKPEIAGPIGVIQLIAKSAKMGIENLLYLLGVISTALGLFNLLPIPLVDGGHITMALIEWVTGKRINKKIIRTANFIGLALIVMIFIFATYSDISRIAVDITSKSR